MDPSMFGKMFMDPSIFQKNFSDQMEKMFIDSMNEMFKNPAFLNKLMKGVELGLDTKKKKDNLMESYLKKMNMPTREDTSKILQYLQKIESKIIDIEEKVEDLTDDVEKMKKKYRKIYQKKMQEIIRL